MAQSILSRTIGGNSDKRLVLSNGEALRTMGILSAWTKCRIGMRVSINGAASITGNPGLFLGLSAGQTNGFRSLTTSHAIGVFTGNSATLTYSGGNLNYSIPWRGCKKVVNARTDASAFASNGTGFVTGDVLNKRSMVILEITKGSPNFSIQVAHCINGISANVDISSAQFLSAMEAGTMAGAAAAWAFDGAVTDVQTIAVDEGTNGSFDSVNVSWDRSGEPVEISDFRFIKVA